jgi:hypothetical protein
MITTILHASGDTWAVTLRPPLDVATNRTPATKLRRWWLTQCMGALASPSVGGRRFRENRRVKLA